MPTISTSPRPDKARNKSAKVTNFSSWVIKAALYALVVLLPLFFLPQTFDALEFNKQNILVILTLVALVGWLGKVISRGRFDIKMNILNIPLLAFIGIYTVASFFSKDRFQSFVGAEMNFLHTAITVICFALLYFIIVNNLESVKNIKSLIFAGLVAAFFVALHGFLQMLGLFILPVEITQSKSFNLIGTFNGYGLFCGFYLVIAISYLTSQYMEQKIKLRDDVKALLKTIFLWVVAGLLLINVVMIDFWPIWVCLLAAMMFILAFSFSRATTMDTKWLMLPMIVLVFSVLFLFVNLPLNLGLPTEVSPNYSASWTIAKGALQEGPLLGSGPGTFLYDYAKYKPAEINQTVFWNIRFDRAVSEFFTYLATLGIIGVVSWLIVVGTFLYLVISRFVRSRSDATWLLGVGFLAAFIFLFCSKFMYVSNITLEFFSWFIFGLLTYFVAGKGEEKQIMLETSPKLALALSFAFILVVTFSASGIYLIGQRFAAEANYKKGMNLAQAADYNFTEVNKTMQRAIQLNKYQDSYYRNLARVYASQLDVELENLSQAKDEEGQLQVTRNVQTLIDGAVSTVKRATELSKNNVTNWDILARIYQKVAPIVSGADDFAITSFDTAIKLEPANPVLYTEQAKTYILKYDIINQALKGENADKLANKAELEQKQREAIDLALEKLEKAIEIKPNYASARYELAFAYVRLGKTAEAIAEMELNRQANPRDVALGLQLSILYYQNDQKDLAVKELERVTKLAPNYSNALWYLASIYEELDRTEDAIKLLEHVAELNQDNEVVEKKLQDLRSGKKPAASGLPEPVKNEPEEGTRPLPPAEPAPASEPVVEPVAGGER